MVPAPSDSSFFVSPQFISVVYHFGGTPYTITGADGNLYFNWAGVSINSNSPNFFSEAGFIDASNSQLSIGGSALNIPVAVSGILGKALVFGVVDTLSVGNGHLHIVVGYDILPT